MRGTPSTSERVELLGKARPMSLTWNLLSSNETSEM